MKATYIDHMGTDLSVVNAAKVSFGKRSEWVETCSCGITRDRSASPNQWPGCGSDVRQCPNRITKTLSQKDRSLIQFLARGCTSGDWEKLVEKFPFICTANQEYDTDVECWTDYDELEELLNHIRKMPSHWSPFAHTAITLHLKMPIFVARQIMKHTTGIEYNEVSRRYVDSEPEFYVPDVWRKKADNVKQGSSDEAVDFVTWQDMMTNSEVGGEIAGVVDDFNRSCLKLYEAMLNCYVCPEQARMVLPQSMYTEVIATGNLYAWANMYNQRTDSHAQKETRDLVIQLGPIVEGLFPVSWKELTNG